MTQSVDSPRASDFMKTHVKTVSPDMPLDKLIPFLLDHRVSNAPVIETAGGRKKLVGFISERDCLAVLSDESFFGSPSPPQTARTIMRRHPVCVTADTELFTLASIFVNHGFRHLPVTDGDTLLGIVSRRDVLRAMNDYYDHSLDEKHRRRFPPDLSQLIYHRFLVAD
ncbi:MAG: CBS domain-containing protein [Planctomycetaceae bacterium]